MISLDPRLHASRFESLKRNVSRVPTEPLLVENSGQLGLFDDFVTKTPEGYSNTIELFDAILRYTSRRVRPTPEPDVRTVTFRQKQVHVTITPANIKRSKGPAVIIMPGEREDLVEKTLRKLAAESVEAWGMREDQSGKMLFSLKFTLYQIRKLLRETGHDFKLVEIDEALRVLQGANIEFDGVLDDFVTGQVSGIITSYKYVRKAKDTTGRASYGEVTFHPLVSASIIQRTFRRIDYGKLMRLKVDLARWLYQRISHLYIQASSEDVWSNERGYHISLKTILAESGMDARIRMRDNQKVVRKALKELEKSGLVRKWDEDIRRKKDPTAPGPAAPYDAVYTVSLSAKFVEDIIEANKAGRVMRAEIARKLGQPQLLK